MTHSRKQISEDGSAHNEFFINEEFIAMLDYYVVTSLSAKQTEAQPLRTFIASGWQCTRPSTDGKTGETGGRGFLGA